MSERMQNKFNAAKFEMILVERIMTNKKVQWE